MFERFIILCLVLMDAFMVKAQYDPSFSHYFDMETSFNPAAVGKQAKLNVAAAYALDMAGFEHNPRTMYVAADLPFYALRSYHGAGVNLVNDQIGLFTHQRLSLQYSYKQRLLGGTLGIGLQGGLISEKFEGTKVDAGESGDPALATSDVNGSGVDLALGLYYMRGPWYLGVSAQHLTSPTVDLGETSEMKIDAVYYLTGGYNIKLINPFLTIKPSMLLKYDGTTWRGDVTGRLVYQYEKKILYAGAAYSPTNSVTILLGGSFHGVVLGYSYEFYTSAISPANGSYELFVGYQTDINLVKKGRNKHKSVRIL